MGDRDDEEDEGQMVETIVSTTAKRARFSVAGLIKFFLMQVGSPAACALLQICDKPPLSLSIWIDKDTQKIHFSAKNVTTSAGFTVRRTYDFVDPLMAAGLCEKLKKALYVWNGADGFKKMVRGLAEYENLGIDLGLSEEDGLRLVAEVIMTYPPQVFYPLPADSEGPIKDLIDELVEQKLDKNPNPAKSFEVFRERVATIRRKTKRGGPQDICRMFLYLMFRSFGTADAERTEFNTAEMRTMVRTAARYMGDAVSALDSLERRLYDFINMLVNCGFARDTGRVARDDGDIVGEDGNDKNKKKKRQAGTKRERAAGKWGIRKNSIYQWTQSRIASPPEGDEQYAILGGRMTESLDAEDREIKVLREMLAAKERANAKRKATLARTLRKKKREEMIDDEDEDDGDNDPRDDDYVGSACVDPIPPPTLLTTRKKNNADVRVTVRAPRPPTVSPEQVTVSKRAIVLKPKAPIPAKKKAKVAKAVPAPTPVPVQEADGDDDDDDDDAEVMLDPSPYYSSGEDMLFGDQGREILSVSDGSSSSSSSSSSGHDSIFDDSQPFPKKTTTLGLYGYAPPPPGF